MGARKQSLDSIKSTIADYRVGEIERPSAEHITRWAAQFDNDIQDDLLTEIDHVLKHTLENMIRECWAKVEWGHGRILVRDGANAGWIDYMLKDRQKSEFDGFLDCIIIESLHNPIADA